MSSATWKFLPRLHSETLDVWREGGGVGHLT
jgi:hypothetical protein